MEIPEVAGVRASSHRRAFAVIYSLLMIAAACGPASESRPPTVIVYGDSLTVQSESAALSVYKATRQNVIFRAGGGTAMCDWLPQAKADNKALHPARIVIAFTGDTATECAVIAYRIYGDEAETAQYEQALRQMRTIFPTQSISLVIPPAVRKLPTGELRFNGNPDLIAMYERVGAELHMTINTDADDNLTPGHLFQQSRPAYPHGESVVVRTADGIHLTPAGALWYGAALLDPHPRQPETRPAPEPTPSGSPNATAGPVVAPTPTPDLPATMKASGPGAERR